MVGCPESLLTPVDSPLVSCGSWWQHPAPESRPPTDCSWHCPTPVIWSPDSTLPKCVEFSLSLPLSTLHLRTTFSSWPAKGIFPFHSPSSWSLRLPITCSCIGSWTTGQLPQDGVSLTLLACLTSGVQRGQPEEGPGAGGTHTVGMYSPGKALVV